MKYSIMQTLRKDASTAMKKTQKDLKLEKNRSGQVEKKNLKKAKPAGPKNLKNSKEQQEMEDQ